MDEGWETKETQITKKQSWLDPFPQQSHIVESHFSHFQWSEVVRLWLRQRHNLPRLTQLNSQTTLDPSGKLATAQQHRQNKLATSPLKLVAQSHLWSALVCPTQQLNKIHFSPKTHTQTHTHMTFIKKTRVHVTDFYPEAINVIFVPKVTQTSLRLQD